MNVVEYITTRYPSAIVRPIQPSPRWQQLRAVWRGDKTPSVGIALIDGKWRWRDYATGQHGDFADFLQLVEGLPKAEAYRIALGDRPDYRPTPSKAKPAEQPQVEHAYKPAEKSTIALLEYGQRQMRTAPETMRGRGFTLREMRDLKLARNNDDTLIPIYRDNVLIAVKRRCHDTARGKYRYIEPGCGSPAWHSPDIRTATEIVVVEGELSAMAVWMALRSSGVGVIGMAGAAQSLHSTDLEAIAGRPVYVIADDDDAGKQAMLRWVRQSNGIGLVPLGKIDACEYQYHYGRDNLAKLLIKRITHARLKRRNSKKQTNVVMASSPYVRGRAVECGVSTGTACYKPVLASTARKIDTVKQSPIAKISNLVQLDAHHTAVLAYLQANGATDSKSIGAYLNVGEARARQILRQMAELALITISREAKMNLYTIRKGALETLRRLAQAVRCKLAPRIAAMQAQFKLAREIFWSWVIHTEAGTRWRESHGSARLPI